LIDGIKALLDPLPDVFLIGFLIVIDKSEAKLVRYLLLSDLILLDAFHFHEFISVLLVRLHRLNRLSDIWFLVAAWVDVQGVGQPVG
jgi:hypothetical protein